MAVVAVGQITITDVNDGLNAILTQESYSVATDASGSGGDYSGASTTISVKLGATDDTASWTISALASPGVIGTLTGATFKVDAMVVDTGYVDLSAIKPGSVALTARFNITKVKQGVVGPGLTLTASAAGFTFTDGEAQPASQIISIKALRQNVSDPVMFYASNGVTVLTDVGEQTPEGAAFGMPITGDGEVCYVTLEDFGTADQMYITAVCGDATAVLNLSKLNYSTAAAGATRNVFRGSWATATLYALGDVTLANGSSWTCILQHTSSGGNAPPTLPSTGNTYWQQYAAKGDRGTLQCAIAIAGTSWVDATANSAIVTAGGVAPQAGDVVTLYNSAASFSQTRVYTSGGSWAVLAAFFGGDVLVDGTVVSSKVAAGAITTNKLAAGAVDAVALAAGSVVAGKVAAGAISTTELSAGAITASKMAITSSASLYPDFNMVDPDFYASSTAASYAFVGTTSNTLGRRWLSVPASGGVDQKVETGWFFIEPNTEYLVEGAAWAEASGAQAKLEFEETSTDLYGNPATSLVLTTVQDATGLFGPASFEAVAVTTNNLTRKARFVLTRVAAGGGTGVAGFGALSVREKSTGSLIVDGAIQATHMAADSVDANSIVAGSITSGLIAVGGIAADRLDINSLLTMDEITAGFSFGKSSANDPSDGLYVGRTEKIGGGVGFGFMMGKTDADGTQRYIQHTSDDGFKIVNANYGLLTDLSAAPVQYNSSQTITLDTTTKLLNMTLLGAGGGGAGGSTNGGNGGNTVVQLWDGSTNTGISWTANGGLGGLTSNHTKAGGGSTPYGFGGRQAYKYITGHTSGGNPNYSMMYATAATGYGSGGGGGGNGFFTPNQSGAAGSIITISGYDIGALGLTTPKLVVTIGGGGAAGTGGVPGTDGRLGMILVQQVLSQVVPCGVVPLYPTITGQFSKPANATGNTIFPDYGPGMWVLADSASNPLYLNKLRIGCAAVGKTQDLVLTNARTVTFVTRDRPNIITGNSNAMTYDYAFHKMKTGV